MFTTFPVVTLTGPRQSGKTTVCRKLFPEMPYLNLERITTINQLKADPERFISNYTNGAIIDEAQNYPEIFSLVQVIVDDDIFKGRTDRHFILTGSSNLALLSKVTQSLAGRTSVLSLLPLSISELNEEQRNLPSDELIFKGGYPTIWANAKDPTTIYSSYYDTYVERDLRQIMNIKDLSAFDRFVRLCAGRIGTEYNATALSNEVDVSRQTIDSWMSVLQTSYIVHLLPPYYENIRKRLVKSPKIYFYDTGLASFLLGIENAKQISTSPFRGQLFENMVVNEMIKMHTNTGKDAHLFFYRDQSQHEVDILSQHAQMLELYEIKSGMSFNGTYYKGIKYLKNLFKDRIVRSSVIYDGSTDIDRDDEGLYNFRRLRPLC